MIKKIICFLLLTLFSYANDATVEIVKKIDVLPKIAIQDASPRTSDALFRQSFFKLLVGDLRVSSHFQVLDEYLQSSYEGGPLENFLSEKRVDLILRYNLTQDFNTMSVSVKLINAKTGVSTFEKIYSLNDKQRHPFLAHKIIVDVNDQIGAPSIKWMEQSVLFARYIGTKKSEIVISDYTLSYQKIMVTGGLNIFPKWANNEQNSFYYTSYNGAEPTIYFYDLKTGARRSIISSAGMLVCSDVSKDGTKLLLTMAPKDQPDIYMYDLRSKKITKITEYNGIDVNGNFIDNDQRIAFVSDRLGNPDIFAQGIYDKSFEKLVYHGKNKNSISTYDNYIVYSSREAESEFGRNTFNLYLISTKTDYLRQLTATGENLYPRFANDPDTIMFIKQYGNQSALGIIRLNANKTYHFTLKTGKLQSIDW
ncbi:Tol-Pal system protein TolB [Sulfurospirillum barnesii]|uniref:Periplasmic component of the Tol biopolymer transport system n=1 Tax=Sulfurospirillum barnesii (strain ATCC 700032 / DSM 10660 / SES-3) TaxID=760154 RepID=I3XVB1_SULBS|nr:Tol-Pal system protein TolB [Sulfurospirillum barnesii]AFL67885.1 periplasmic component of the Tol biopolymer transport system [Sulfurospirillum barnesii SES-3]